MIMFIAFIIFLLMIVSIISLIIGLIVPSAFTGLFKRNLGRKKTGLIFSGMTFVLFVILIVLAVNSPSSTTELPQKNKHNTANKIRTAAIKPSVDKSKTIKPKSSPVPTDPCENKAGTLEYAPCEDSIAPTEPKLVTTVKTSDQYLIVTNNSNIDWTDCYVSIGSDINPNSFYQQDPSSSSSIPAGGTLNFLWSNIVKLDGTRFNFTNTAPNDIIVGCNVGNNSTGIWTNYP